MMRSEAITIIKRGLGYRQTQDASIVAALKQAQRDAELGQTLPNWLVAFNAPLNVIQPFGAVDAPPGFIRLHDEYPMFYFGPDGDTVSIPRRNQTEAIAAYGQAPAVAGTYPQVMSVLNKTLFGLYPAPGVSFTAYLNYYKAEPVLDSDIENQWLKYAPNYIVGMAGVHVAGDLRDRAAAEKFNLMARIGQKALLGDIVEDELAGRPLIMGRNN